MSRDVQLYLDELRNHLAGHLTAAEIDDVVEFYAEYLQDAGLVTKAEVEARLGNPKQLTHKVLADYSINPEESNFASGSNDQAVKEKIQKQGGRSNVALIWIIILAIASTPLTLPLAFAFLAVLLAGVLTLGALLVAAVMMVGAAIVLSLVAIYIGIMMLMTDANVALFYLGAGVTGLGALFIGIPIVISVLRWAVAMIAIAISWLYRKITKKQPKVKGDNHEETN